MITGDVGDEMLEPALPSDLARLNSCAPYVTPERSVEIIFK